MIIYIHTNTITNKSYIGQTIQLLEARWKTQCNDAIKNRYNNKYLNAIRKYGTECWTHKILEEVSNINFLNDREVYWISYFDTVVNGYNSTWGGKQRQKVSEETIKKLSESHKGIKPSQETIEKRRIANTGKKRSIEFCNYMKLIQQGKNNNNIGTIWINNDVNTIKINCNLLEKYLNLGYKKGRILSDKHKKNLKNLNKGFKWYNNGSINKKLHQHEIDNFLLIGFKKGRLPFDNSRP